MPLLLRRPTGTDQRRAGDGILHRHLSELGSPCAPVLPPNLSGATAIPGVIPFDGERSRDPPSRRDRNATIWIVRASPAARSHSPDPRAVSAGSHRRHCIGSAPLPREFSRAPLAATSASPANRSRDRIRIPAGGRVDERNGDQTQLRDDPLLAADEQAESRSGRVRCASRPKQKQADTARCDRKGLESAVSPIQPSGSNSCHDGNYGVQPRFKMGNWPGRQQDDPPAP